MRAICTACAVVRTLWPELDANVENVLRQPAGEVDDRRIRLAGVEQHHVDVGVRRLLPPAIAAVGHERHPLAELRGLASGRSASAAS